MRANEKTILELIHYSGISEPGTKDAQIIGHNVSNLWRDILPNEPPAKVDQVEGDDIVKVNIYPREFWPVVLNIILAYYQEKRATAQPKGRKLGRLRSLATLRASTADT